MRHIASAAIGVLAAVAMFIAPAQAATTTTPFVCGAGNEGLDLTCGGTITVDDVADTVVLTFTTFEDSGSQIQTLGIQLPGTATFDETGTDTLNAALGNNYVAGNMQGDFDAEIVCDTNQDCLGDGDAPFSLGFAYDGTDFVAAAVTDPSNRTGSCDGFQNSIWGCAHVFRFDPQTGNTATSQFVPLRSPGEVVPEPGTLALLGVGLLGVGVAARRRLTK